MQKIVDCKLVINRVVDKKEETSVVQGKGYYRIENDEKIVFFTSENIKYKYIYSNGILTVLCNDSRYVFKENIKEIGEIKNGDYIFKVTTFASKIEVCDSYIILNYSLYQADLIGSYTSKLSFN
jgi:hypothetical protein